MGLIAWWKVRKERQRAAQEARERQEAWDLAVAHAEAGGARKEALRGPGTMVTLDSVPDDAEKALHAVGFRRTGTAPQDAAVPGKHSRTWIWLAAPPPPPNAHGARSASSPLDVIHGRR